jgi:hypothetical protein
MTDILSTLETNVIVEAQPAEVAAATAELVPALLIAATVAALLAAITSVIPPELAQLSLLTMN